MLSSIAVLLIAANPSCDSAESKLWDIESNVKQVQFCSCLGSELSSFKRKTRSALSDIEDRCPELKSRIDSLKSKVAELK